MVLRSITLPSLEEFKERLKEVDWWYAMSDDYSVYTKGETEANLIRTFIKIGGDEYLKAYQDEAEKVGYYER